MLRKEPGIPCPGGVGEGQRQRLGPPPASTSNHPNASPPITRLAILSATAAVYLTTVATTTLLRRDYFSFSAGASLLAGFETAGPLAFLFGAAAYALIVYGLWTLRNWARQAIMGLAALHAIFALPRVSENAISLSIPHLAQTGFPIIAAPAVIFYLAKPSTAALFQQR